MSTIHTYRMSLLSHFDIEHEVSFYIFIQYLTRYVVCKLSILSFAVLTIFTGCMDFIFDLCLEQGKTRGGKNEKKGPTGRKLVMSQQQSVSAIVLFLQLH